MLYVQPVVEENQVTEPKIFIFYGPSGTGKSFWKDFLTGELKVGSLVDIIKEYPRSVWKEVGTDIFRFTGLFTRHFHLFTKITTMTTRPPREGEIQGIHYHFLTKTAFEKEREAGNVLEETKNFHHLYGTNRRDVDEALQQGRNVVVVLDNKGVKKFKQFYGDKVVSVYLQPNVDIMKERMEKRKDQADTIAVKLTSIADENHAEGGLSDYQIDTSQRIDEIMSDVLSVIFKEAKMKDLSHVIQKKTVSPSAVLPDIPVISSKQIR